MSTWVVQIKQFMVSFNILLHVFKIVIDFDMVLIWRLPRWKLTVFMSSIFVK